jgi:hypothetical protein
LFDLPDLAAALAFIDAHASGDRVRAIREDQNPDGGWPAFWSGGVSSLDATCYALDRLESLGKDARRDERAASFLLGRRHSDGSFTESEALAETAPPWADPRDPAANLYVTANCAFWLARLRGDHGSVAFLAARLEDPGGPPMFLQSRWLSAAVLALGGRTDDADRVAAALEPRVDELGSTALAWLVNALTAAGAREFPVVHMALDRLESLQADDGRWASEDGSAFDLDTTSAALRAFAQ